MTAFAHEAVLVLDEATDPGAPGAAITVALCGHWEHEGPCRWPHHTSYDLAGRAALVRCVFVAADPADPRARIVSALRSQLLRTPDGDAGWRLRSEASADLLPDELALADRLAQSTD